MSDFDMFEDSTERAARGVPVTAAGSSPALNRRRAAGGILGGGPAMTSSPPGPALVSGEGNPAGGSGSSTADAAADGTDGPKSARKHGRRADSSTRDTPPWGGTESNNGSFDASLSPGLSPSTVSASRVFNGTATDAFNGTGYSAEPPGPRKADALEKFLKNSEPQLSARGCANRDMTVRLDKVAVGADDALDSFITNSARHGRRAVAP
jgi:hypothetical protein